jgi:hypothetical protein
MAASPAWKVYTRRGEYIAAVRAPEYGAMILAGIGEDGTTIRLGHDRITWIEGQEPEPASESYDMVGDVCRERARAGDWQKPWAENRG